MVLSDGYSLEYYTKSNQIVIQCPQRIEFLTNTVASITNVSHNLTDAEKFAILGVVKALMEGGKC